MEIERRKAHLRNLEGRNLSPMFFVSNERTIEGLLNYRYLVVDEGDTHGLIPGIYVQTDITPDYYNGFLEARLALRSNVVLELARLEKETRGERYHPLGPVNFEQAYLGQDDVLVLRVTLADG